jgi:Glycosyltransferases involved in cell wall biogenesis
MEEQPLVTIRCITYNHEPYIRQCLEGFVMQKTNFKFEAVVHDDASTDKTADIVREYAERYPDIIKPIYEIENQYSKRNTVISDKINALTKGKYIALCEGDDYWIDPLKLQKQVDFLEANPEYGMCYTDYALTEGKKIRRNYVRNSCDSYLADYLEGRCTIATLTTCFRKDIYDSLPKYWSGKHWAMGDKPMWIELLHVSKAYYIDEVTAIYRVLSNSASHGSLEKEIAFKKCGLEISKFYKKKFNLEIEISNKNHYESIMKSAFQHGNKQVAKEYFNKAKDEGKLSYKTYFWYAVTIYPFGDMIVRMIYKIIGK